MSLEKGCQVAVETCMGVHENDSVVILSDEASKKIGMGLRNAALEATPKVRYFNLELYGERPLKEYPKPIKDATKDATVTFWTAGSVKGELETIRQPFIKAALTGGRHAHMVDVTEEIMETGMAADYHEVSRFTESLYDKLKNTKEIRVTNPQGTDLTARFEMVKWAASTGINHVQGHWINLPSGEIFTAPTEIEGKMVVDGVLGEYIGERYHHADLLKTPITLEIGMNEHGKVKNLECDNEELLNELEEYLNLHECSKWVGEFGLGTNMYLKNLIDNMLQDEKFPGVHVAFGDPIQTETYAGWTCPEHLDMVLTHCDVWLDGQKIMEDSEYIVEF